MSILDEVLLEEYERMIRILDAMMKEFQSLPKGYISRKLIGGREFHNLQKREGNKIVSTYIRPNELQVVEAQVKRRKELGNSIRELRRELKKIKKVVG